MANKESDRQGDTEITEMLVTTFGQLVRFSKGKRVTVGIESPTGTCLSARIDREDQKLLLESCLDQNAELWAYDYGPVVFLWVLN